MSLAANPNFGVSPWDVGETSNVDLQGNTWTLTGGVIARQSYLTQMYGWCKIAFGDTWQDASQTWTDVTNYLREFSVSWGRSSEYDRFRAGVCSLRLSNADRRFEPDYVSGAYYPNVVPWVPVKVGVTFTDGRYTTEACLFSGFVERWVLEYPGVTDSVARVEATDGMKIPAQYQISVSLSSGAPGSMMSSALDTVGWNASTLWRTLSSGAVSLDGTTPSNADALTVLSKLADSDGGWLFSMPHTTAHTPRIVFLDRTWPMSNATVQCTFGETSDYTRYSDIQLTYDEERVRNRWRVGIEASTKVAQSDSTVSQNLYGLRVQNLTGLLLPTTGAADDRALAGVHVTATPALTGVVSCPLHVGMDYDRAVDLSVDAYQPLKWVTVRRGGMDEEMTVDGCQVDYAVGGVCRFVYRMSPASLAGEYWLLGDADLGKLDTATYLGW